MTYVFTDDFLNQHPEICLVREGKTHRPAPSSSAPQAFDCFLRADANHRRSWPVDTINRGSSKGLTRILVLRHTDGIIYSCHRMRRRRTSLQVIRGHTKYGLILVACLRFVSCADLKSRRLEYRGLTGPLTTRSIPEREPDPPLTPVVTGPSFESLYTV
jgi:hypothetical protein